MNNKNLRVLWFPGNGANYSNTNKYNGGGWTSALVAALKTQSNIKLGLVIPWNKYFKEEKDGIIFYGLPAIRHSFIAYERKLNSQVAKMKFIVNDFSPDIIHIFGSEHTGGMVSTITDVPVVLHLQGILNYLKEAWLPYNLSWGKLFSWNPRKLVERKWLLKACETEQNILQSCNNYMGRTEMDYRVISLLSPNSQYYYCSEMLRPLIYNSKKIWYPHLLRKKKIIVSIISSPLYKGGDIILRAANVLKKNTKMEFEWHVFGIHEMKDWNRLTGINPDDVNVKIGGVLTAEQLIDKVTDADVYVHPSYIENSPNTVCEAQLLGAPVIANNVGGISTLINNNETGILVPANDIYQTASHILELCENTEKAEELGEKARNSALKRHNPADIVSRVLEIYKQIVRND